MEASSFYRHQQRRRALLVSLLVVALSCFRLAHVHLLWADEDYHLAAAINYLHGKIPYRDFWYDKPPLTAAYYLLVGGWSGWPLRILDAAYISTSCYVAYRFAKSWWGQSEGYVAALLLVFFTTFYLPSAVIAFAADAVMVLPHLAAVYCAYQRKTLLAGTLAGAAFLINTKALFVLASCSLFLFPELLLLSTSFTLTTAVGFGTLAALGAWPGYVEQVWRWGLIYTKGPPVLHPWVNGAVRTMNWTGFHLLPVLASGYSVSRAPRRDQWKLAGWLGLSFLAVALGARFAPHYFLQLLPPMVIAGSRGVTLAFHNYRRLAVLSTVLLLIIPAARFGPRYFTLALHGGQFPWTDAAMDLDSQSVATLIEPIARPGDTLLVWGYRPDIYVLTRMTSDSRFWDSQPLTGVPADRHLSTSVPIYSKPAEINRKELTRSSPTWIVDGLGLLNPKLRLDGYQDLHSWFKNYTLVKRTSMSLIYRRRN